MFSIFSSIPDHNLHNTLEHSNKGEIDTKWMQIYPVYIYTKRHALMITRTKYEFEFSVFATLKKFSQQLYYGMFG